MLLNSLPSDWVSIKTVVFLDAFGLGGTCYLPHHRRNITLKIKEADFPLTTACRQNCMVYIQEHHNLNTYGCGNFNPHIGSIFQVGVALGFLIPPAVVRNHERIEDIGRDLKNLYYGMAIGPTIMLCLVLFCKKPSHL